MVGYMIIWNLTVFIIYGIDKLKAIRGSWRISEKALLFLAFFMGGVGAYLGMQIFSHKTKKTKFAVLVPVAVILNMVVFYYSMKQGSLK